MYVGDENDMRPKMGDTDLSLPVTFDYSGGRGETNRSYRIWAVVVGVVGLILVFGLLFNSKGFWVLNIVYAAIVGYACSWVIRFVFLHEKDYRKVFNEIDSTDYERTSADIWGIYDIDTRYPYIVRYKASKSGVFVSLNKDVILGKYEESEYNHYEAIGEAYNIAGSSSIQMCHVDYMDHVGSDDRLQNSMSALADIRNPDLRDIMTDVYTHLQEQMNERVSTFDVYVFTWRGVDDRIAWNNVQKILSVLVTANYVSYQVLDQKGIRDLAQSLFNISSFNSLQAMSDMFKVSDAGKSIVFPISLTHVDGTKEKLGKTRSEKEEQEKVKEREKELQKESKIRRKRRAKAVVDDEDVIDIFDD